MKYYFRRRLTVSIFLLMVTPWFILFWLVTGCLTTISLENLINWAMDPIPERKGAGLKI